MAGRTHLQHALPITFGYKAAVWLAGFDRHARRLAELKPRVLVAQFGGAAGTLASLGEGEAALASCTELARELGLGEPAITWHVARDRSSRPCSSWPCSAAASARSHSTSC